MKGKRTFSLSNINNNNNNTDLLPAEAAMKPGPPQASPQVSPVCLCGGRPGQTTPDLSPTHSHIYSDKRVLKALLCLLLRSCGLSALEQLPLQKGYPRNAMHIALVPRGMYGTETESPGESR